MKRIASYTIMIAIGAWVVLSYLMNSLAVYTTDRYLLLVTVAGLASMLLGLLGIVFELKNEVSKKAIKVESDPKLLLFGLTIILGLFISPFFLLIALFLIFIPLKSPYFDKLMDRSIFVYGAVIVIAITGILLPSSPLSSALADQRVGNLNSVVITSAQSISHNFNTSTKNYNIGDWIMSLTFNPDLSFYKDKDVELTGFIFSPDNLDDDEFMIARFVVRCCAADATPIGLKVRYEGDFNFKEGDWIKTTGKFDITNRNGYEELIIIPDNISATSIPERPYLN